MLPGVPTPWSGERDGGWVRDRGKSLFGILWHPMAPFLAVGTRYAKPYGRPARKTKGIF